MRSRCSVFDFSDTPFKSRIHAAGHIAHADDSIEEIWIRLGILAGHDDVMGLDVKDEVVRVAGSGTKIEELGGVDPEKWSEDGVHGCKSEGHAG